MEEVGFFINIKQKKLKKMMDLSCALEHLQDYDDDGDDEEGGRGGENQQEKEKEDGNTCGRPAELKILDLGCTPLHRVQRQPRSSSIPWEGPAVAELVICKPKNQEHVGLRGSTM